MVIKNCFSFIERLIKLVVLIAAAGLGSPAFAIDYDVEVIIFEHIRNTDVGSSDVLLMPVIPQAELIPPLQIDSAANQAPTQDPNVLILPLGSLRLADHAEKIRDSANHRLVYHGGWRQSDFSEEAAPYMQIAMGQQVPMFTEPADPDSLYLRGYPEPPFDSTVRLEQKVGTTLYGGIKVWVGRFLHFDTLLSYTPPGSTVSFPMLSERRLRSRQLHYIDNPRFGIITKIFPVDQTAAN